jgi:hypothetical protein
MALMVLLWAMVAPEDCRWTGNWVTRVCVPVKVTWTDGLTDGLTRLHPPIIILQKNVSTARAVVAACRNTGGGGGGGPEVPGSRSTDSAPNKNEYQELFWG